MKIKTILGTIEADSLGITLPHEHITCYSEAVYQMAGEHYLDKKYLAEFAARHLRELNARYGLNTFIDCTPLNIGRDIDLLKRTAELSELNILASTGLYYTRDPLFNGTSPLQIGKYLTLDIERNGAAIIKCAVEEADCSPFDDKVLRGCAIAHKETGAPIVLHTNAIRKNARWAMEILLGEGVAPEAVTIGHLSDAKDMDYLLEMASYGSYIGLDRIYDNPSPEYIKAKLDTIDLLVKNGYEDKILLSHDEQFFSGFAKEPDYNENHRFAFSFRHIAPALSPELSRKIFIINPTNMLMCR